MADNELGAFLRAKREAVKPADAAVPGGGRRRTPGLRRAELAVRAGVSVEYLTRLEQGRDRRPSAEVVTALADALDLSVPARVHLHRLTKSAGGGACAPPSRFVRPVLAELLGRLDATPALIVNHLDDVLASTTAFQRVAAPWGLLEATEPNLARYVFTDHRARGAYPDWGSVADQRVAVIRSAVALGDPHAADFAKELSNAAGRDFADRFDGGAGELPVRTGIERWSHPDGGESRMAFEVLGLPGDEEHRMVVYLPAGDSRH